MSVTEDVFGAVWASEVKRFRYADKDDIGRLHDAAWSEFCELVRPASTFTTMSEVARNVIQEIFIREKRKMAAQTDENVADLASEMADRVMDDAGETDLVRRARLKQRMVSAFVAFHFRDGANMLKRERNEVAAPEMEYAERQELLSTVMQRHAAMLVYGTCPSCGARSNPTPFAMMLSEPKCPSCGYFVSREDWLKAIRHDADALKAEAKRIRMFLDSNRGCDGS